MRLVLSRNSFPPSQSKHSGSHSKNNGCNLLLHKLFTDRFYNLSLEKEIIHKPTPDEMNRNTERNTHRPVFLPFFPAISKQMFCNEPQSLPSCSDGNSEDVHTHRQLAEQRENKLQKVQKKDESRNLLTHGKSLNAEDSLHISSQCLVFETKKHFGCPIW